MPDQELTDQLQELDQLQRQPLFPTGIGQFAAGLAGFGAGISGQPNPVVEQALHQRRVQLEAIRTRQVTQRLRNEQTRMKLKLARDLFEFSPATGLQVYEDTGLLTLDPASRQAILSGAEAKQIPNRVEAVIGALESGLDPAGLPPALTQGINVQMLRLLPPSVLADLAPERKTRALTLLTKEVEAQAKLTALARDRRLEAGTATPADLLLKGISSPEGIGQALLTQSATRGAPVPIEYQGFLTAYRNQKRVEGLTGSARLAMEAAVGDPQAVEALRLFREATKQDKLVGEVPRPMMNRAGEYAPSDLPVKEATRAGFAEVSPREEAIVRQLPAALTMLGNLVQTARQLRDAGATRTDPGVRGTVQAGRIKVERLFGNPQGAGGLLRLWDGQKSELISLYRQLGEKGNIAARIMTPQLQAMTPEAGFPTIMRLLKFMEGQLKADVRQSRIPGFESRLPALPTLLFPADPRYKTLRDRGLTDRDIEAKGDILVVK